MVEVDWGGSPMFDLSPLLTEVLVSAAIVVVSGVLILGLSLFLQRLARRGGARRVTVNSIRDAMRIVWVVAAAAGVVTYTGIASQFTLLTFSGLAGLAVTLSLQTTLSNLVSGLFLLQDRAVRQGDVIEYGNVKGRVVRFALRNTWVLMDNGKIAIISNSNLMGGPLINHTSSQRFVKDFGLEEGETTNATGTKPAA